MLSLTWGQKSLQWYKVTNREKPGFFFLLSFAFHKEAPQPIYMIILFFLSFFSREGSSLSLLHIGCCFSGRLKKKKVITWQREMWPNGGLVSSLSRGIARRCCLGRHMSTRNSSCSRKLPEPGWSRGLRAAHQASRPAGSRHWADCSGGHSGSGCVRRESEPRHLRFRRGFLLWEHICSYFMLLFETG